MMTIWVAESENGTVQFDSPPSASDVRNCCEDLEYPIEVFQVECIEVSREPYLTLGTEGEREW
jgi:hypothetical protein